MSDGPAAASPGVRGRAPLRPPVFEIGLKGYLYGAAAVRLAVAADRLAAEHDVAIVFDPQAVDIAAVAAATSHLLVFAQHVDPVTIGRGVGAVLAEAVREAGAQGVLLNHSERRLTLADLRRTIERAKEVGLATLVCADSPEEAAAIAMLGPDIVLAEPPELIATGRSTATAMRDFVERSIDLVRRVDPSVLVMCSAGIRTARDAADMMRLGVDGTGSTSGILKASDPVAQMRAMVESVAETWREIHPGDPAARSATERPTTVGRRGQP
ncbi:MAG TPA: triose-phosphate isomerase [Candidatus Binatus sp.]|nr:triose-phosphate isomerase [Candidatus Binatus sp.]